MLAIARNHLEAPDPKAPLLAGAVAGLLLCAVPADATSFTLDPPSPSSCTTSLGACILAEGPVEIIDLAALGLGPDDVIDAISAGDDPIRLSHGPRDWVFSVTRSSQGLAGTDVRASLPDGEGDMFLWEGVSGANVLAFAPRGWAAQDGEEHRAGLVTTGPGDNVTGLERTDLTWVVTNPPAPPSFEIYFSLRAGSPALSAYGFGPADIIVIGGAYGLPTLFRSAADLGIPAGADVELDALALHVSGGDPDNPGGSGSVLIRYSVDSASTGFVLNGSGDTVNSGAMILGSRGTGTGRIIHRANRLGLRAADDIDALEAESRDAEATVFDGLDVLPLGSAGLSIDPDGSLVAAPIDDSGENGIWVPNQPIYWYDGGNDVGDDLLLEIVGLGQQPDGASIAVEKLSEIDGAEAYASMRFTDVGESLRLDILGGHDGNGHIELSLDGVVQWQEPLDESGEALLTIMDDTAWPVGLGISDQAMSMLLPMEPPIWIELDGGQQVLADEIRMIEADPGAVVLATAVTGIDLGTITLTGLSSGSNAPEADLDNDGMVGVTDLLITLAAWGTDPGGPPDFDGDGTVAINDLLMLLADWGEYEP